MIKIKLFIVTIFILISNGIFSQKWNLKKTGKNFKAYTSETEGSKVKSFKMIATINSPLDCIYKTLTDYDNYVEMFKEIKKFEIIKQTDSTLLCYSMYESPWPVQDRDLISTIKISKRNNIYYIKTRAVNEKSFRRKTDIVRMFDYKEDCIIEKKDDQTTQLTITGHFDAGGAIPAMMQNVYIIDGVEGLIEILKKKCE